MSERPTVALLGTGIMGAGMARNIAAAGLPLRVWNRTREKAEPLAETGAEVTESPTDAVRGADVVVTMLFDADAVAKTLEEARDGLGQGAVLLQQSTVGVDGADRLAGVAEKLGLVYVDAPVLGTRKPAEEGALTVLASGPAEVRDRVEPVLDAIGSRTIWLGAAGQGSRLKLVANSWVLTVVEGIAESLTLARALGVEPAAFLDVVKGGAMDAPYVQLKGSAMLEGNFEPAFGLDGAAKDAGLIVAAARAAGADLAVLEAVQGHLARAVDAGHGGLDMAATYLAH
jgi:3-hydroxyisobutyrate dehydrogenase